MSDAELPTADVLLEKLLEILAAARHTHVLLDRTEASVDELVGGIRGADGLLTRAVETRARVDALEDALVEGFRSTNAALDRLEAALERQGGALRQIGETLDRADVPRA